MKSESNVSVKEVMALDIFKDAQLVAGENGLNNIIRSVNLMLDDQIVNWVTTEGQLVLTIGRMFEKMDEEQQKDLFRYLSSKHVACIFIKIKPYIDDLSKEVIEVCNEMALPVVGLPFETTFTAAIEAVYALMHQKQTAILNRVEDLHKDTMKVVSSGGKIQDILKSLYKTIKNPIFIRDYYFEDTYYLKDKYDDDYRLLYENIENTYYEEKNNKIIWDTIQVKDREVERLIIPIIVKNIPYGHMIAFGEKGSFSNYDKLGLESTSHIVAIEFLNKLSLQEVDNKYKLEFFDDLISNDQSRKQKAIERASNYRFTENANYAIISVGLDGKNKQLTTEDNYHKIVYLINLICKDRGRPYLIFNKGTEIYLLIMLKDQENREILERYTKYIYEVLVAKFKKFNIYLGVGRIYRGLEFVDKSLKDSQKSLHAAQKYKEEQIIYFEDLGIYKILSQDHLEKELRTFYQETLEPLDNYDKKKDTELMRTLEVYFENNGNLKKMSEALYTHYNTILYRVNRIEEITQFNLNDEEDRFALHTALKIKRILME